MTSRRLRATASSRIAVAGVIFAGAALALAGQATADPDVLYPTPAPGQPVADAPADPAAAPVPPPIGPPPVPEIQNPVYGSGKTNGPLGSLRDAFNQAKDPYGTSDLVNGMPAVAPPPPGAGPPPPLPPGYVSLTAPGSETIAAPKAAPAAGPALPPGYYPLNGPPPPGYGDPAAPPPVADPAAPPPVVDPIAPLP